MNFRMLTHHVWLSLLCAHRNSIITVVIIHVCYFEVHLFIFVDIFSCFPRDHVTMCIVHTKVKTLVTHEPLQKGHPTACCFTPVYQVRINSSLRNLVLHQPVLFYFLFIAVFCALLLFCCRADTARYGSYGGHDPGGDDGRGSTPEARQGARSQEGGDGAAPHEPARPGCKGCPWEWNCGCIGGVWCCWC